MSQQLVTYGTTGSPGNATIRGCRWDGVPGKNEPVVEAFGQGPFTITDNVFRTLNGRTPFVRANCYQDTTTWKRFHGSAEVSRNRFESLQVVEQRVPKKSANIILPRDWDVTVSGNLSWYAVDGEFVQPARIEKTR
jgi:hypothetical protein